MRLILNLRELADTQASTPWMRRRSADDSTAGISLPELDYDDGHVEMVNAV